MKQTCFSSFPNKKLLFSASQNRLFAPALLQRRESGGFLKTFGVTDVFFEFCQKVSVIFVFVLVDNC